MDALHHRTAPADIVWIGLSLHHSRLSEKRAVVRDVRRILAPGGLFLFYENTRRDGERRNECLPGGIFSGRLGQPTTTLTGP